MGTPTWGELWTRWFNAYRENRPSDGPVGWYTIADLREAFDAGSRADHEQNMARIWDKIHESAKEWPQA